MSNSNQSTNFRMDHILRDSQRANIQQPGVARQPQNLPPSAAAAVPTPHISTTKPTPPLPTQQQIPIPSSSAFQQQLHQPIPIVGPPPPAELQQQLSPHGPFFWPPLIEGQQHCWNPAALPLLMRFGPPPQLLAATMAAFLQYQQFPAFPAPTFPPRQQQQFMSPTFDTTPAGSSTSATNSSNSTAGSSNDSSVPVGVGRRAENWQAPMRQYGTANFLAGRQQETPRAGRSGAVNKDGAPARIRCEICGKSFGRPWLLNGHMRIHDGQRPFQCEFAGCNKAFADRSNCRAHERTHHVEKPFACGMCTKKFKLKAYLTKHMKSCGRQQREQQQQHQHGQGQQLGDQ